MNFEKISITLILIASVILIGTISFGLFVLLAFQNTPQQPAQKMLTIGIPRFIDVHDPIIGGLKTRMEELGYKEGSNIHYIITPYGVIPPKVPALVKELIANDVDIIFAITTVSARAALQETQAAGRTDIPIVFSHGLNAVSEGIAESYQSSGNNTTGIEVNFANLVSKKLDFIRQMDPAVKKIGFFRITEDIDIATRLVLQNFLESAPQLGFEIVQYDITGTNNTPGPETTQLVQQTVDTIQAGDIDAYFHIPGPALSNLASKQIIIDMTKRLQIPSAWSTPTDVHQGGLFTYGYDLNAIGRQSATLIHKIILGTKPQDIPIEFAEKHDFFLNTTTQNDIGLKLSESFLQLVDVKIQ